jgi:prevent-host-death family protein
MCHNGYTGSIGFVRSLSIRELREALPAIDAIVEREGEVLVTRHGRPVAKLVPVTAVRRAPSHAGLRAGMPRMAVSSEELVRADRERV